MNDAAEMNEECGAPPIGSRLVPEVLQRLLSRFRPSILRALRARMSSRLRAVYEPEDIWQETSIEALAGAADFRWQGVRAFERWLMTLASRRLSAAARHCLGRDLDRPEMVSLSELSLAIARSSTGPATGAERRDEVDRVMRALNRMADGERDVLTLAYVHLMTHDEMAHALQKSKAAVAQAHFRAIKSIRAVLES